MLFNNVFENSPNFATSAVYYAFGALYVMRSSLLNELAHNKRLKQFERHFFGKSALIHFEFGTNNYNASTRIVYALSEKVLAETSLLAAQKSRKAFEFAVARARNRLAASSVVYKRVDGFLKHTLRVSNNNIRRAKL